MPHMKKAIKSLATIIIATATLCSCGEDRSAEFYELTKENRWTYDTMKEVYLWGDSIDEDISQQTYFSTPEKFFYKLLYKADATSFFTNSTTAVTYGFKFSLMRDPLGIAPAKVYALVEYVEPASVAAAAGLERGMWISTINGVNINMGVSNALVNGGAKTLGVNRIVFDDDNEQYLWEELPQIEIQAAIETTASPLPLVKTISDTAGSIGYILCNSFDGEETVAEINDALSTLSAEGVSNIVLDLRYNTGNSLANAAAVAAAFIPTDKQSTPFCLLYKDLKLTTKEDMPLPASTINVSNIPLYIITTAQTKGTANAFIKAIRIARGSSTVKIAGTTASGTNIATESIASPYDFDINPATAIIFDTNNEPLYATAPDYMLNEFEDYKNIYPLGNKQEYILYNISYIIANGALPANK